jgi:proteic killer suppression protein
MIKSFKDDQTKAAFEGESSKGFPADLLKVARRKLNYLVTELVNIQSA